MPHQPLSCKIHSTTKKKAKVLIREEKERTKQNKPMKQKAKVFIREKIKRKEE